LEKEEFIPGFTPFTRKRKVNVNTGPQLLRKKAVKKKTAGKGVGKGAGKSAKKSIKRKAAAGEVVAGKNIVKTGTVGKGAAKKGNRKRKNDDDSEDFKPAVSRRRKR
jgi:hypothetical protein